MKLKKYLLAIATFLFGIIGSGVLFAAPSGFALDIEGRVSDEAGSPLAGAMVSVFGESLVNGPLITLTNQKGEFQVPGVRPGTYNLRAFVAGFMPSELAKVVIEEGLVSVKTILMSLTALGGENLFTATASKTNETGTLDEFRWLLAHGDRNILRDREWNVLDKAPLLQTSKDSFYDFNFGGEFGLTSSAYGEGYLEFPGSGSMLDAQVAYARLAIPTKNDGYWNVSAQLLESTLSSWAGRAEYVKNSVLGNKLATGVTYGNYIYGDIEGFRPPESKLISGESKGHASKEWFGTVYATANLLAGPVSIDGRFAYEHFGYLQKSGYTSPSLYVSYPVDDGRQTVVVAGVDYNILPPGGEDIGLLSQVALSDSYAGSLTTTVAPLKAESTSRVHIGLEREVNSDTRLTVRVFQEDSKDQLLKIYSKDKVNSLSAGYFRMANLGEIQMRGIGLKVSHALGLVNGSIGYTFGLGSMKSQEIANTSGFFLTEGPGSDQIHDLTTTLGTTIEKTRTRFQAVYRLVNHPSLNADLKGKPSERDSTPSQTDVRFNFQLFQVLPFVGWNGTSFELMLAVRNLFYEDIEGMSLIDEISVVDAPRRILGGVTVRF